MARHLAAVVIPIYKENLTLTEVKSLQQCTRVLHSHPIILVSPVSLNTLAYEKLCVNIQVDILRLEDHYFESITSYNRLLLSPFFYKNFFKYKFILIYQLDAWVFSDQLYDWCKWNFDFIGAPQQENFENNILFLNRFSRYLQKLNSILGTGYQISQVGNGGFSLRKVRKNYWFLTVLKYQVKKWGNNNEDVFFKYWGNLLFPFYKLPVNELALRFSIEHHPGESLEKLKPQLPFGCHAFEKYEPQIWKKYIDF